MHYLYNIINKNDRLKLWHIKKINIEDDVEYSEEELIEIMNFYFRMNELDSEELYVVGFDNWDRPMNFFLASSGKTDETDIDVRKIFSFLLLSGAKGFRVYHNHPDDILEISEPDIKSRGMLYSAGLLMNIELRGSFIITKSGWAKIDTNEFFKY